MSEAGVVYTLVDDSHFKFAGIRTEAITGYYMTEDQGRTLSVFPMDEKLRHYVPFQPVEETIKYAGTLATEGGDRIMIYGDDGEKFGSWPQTYKHIYEDGWLKRFFEALVANARVDRDGHARRGVREPCAEGQDLPARLQLPRDDGVGAAERGARGARGPREGSHRRGARGEGEVLLPRHLLAQFPGAL